MTAQAKQYTKSEVMVWASVAERGDGTGMGVKVKGWGVIRECIK